MNKVTLSVISDICTDQRVLRAAGSLMRNGYDVTIVGRQLKNSKEISVAGINIKRFRLMFNKGPLFYATYNIRLFFYLLSKDAGILLANDLDTLPANYLVSVLKGNMLIYDSHEYFTEVPEIQNRPHVKSVWKFIERMIFPKLKHIYTVNESIASLYRDAYGKKVDVVRNVPQILKIDLAETRQQIRTDIGVCDSERLIILQGAGINVNRGAEEAVMAMLDLKDFKLLIAGSGDVIEELKTLVRVNNLESKVVFRDKMPYEKLMRYTAAADLGLTLDKDSNLNYKFSLPNKLFDYIQAGIPVLCSDLPEVSAIVKTYKIGVVISAVDPQLIANAVIGIFADESSYNRLKNNTQIAAASLNWEVEEKVLIDIFNQIEK